MKEDQQGLAFHFWEDFMLLKDHKVNWNSMIFIIDNNSKEKNLVF